MINHVNRFLVVLVFAVLPIDALSSVNLLLKLKHVMVELLLQLLVSVIDAKLLKGVHIKYLKSKDIQKTDELRLDALPSCSSSLLNRASNRGVHFINDPCEDFSIEVLDKGISGLHGFLL